MSEPTPSDSAEQEIKVRVALCREADDLRALHKLIGLQRGEEPWTYWDTSGVALASPVEGLLGICGFAGQSPQLPQVRELSDEDVSCVPLLGFTVPEDAYAEVRSAIMTMAGGQIGGFAPLVSSQSGFHDAALDVFAYVWSQSGRPSIWVRCPAAASRGGGTTVPQAVTTFARRDTSFRASEYLRSLLQQSAGR